MPVRKHGLRAREHRLSGACDRRPKSAAAREASSPSRVGMQPFKVRQEIALIDVLVGWWNPLDTRPRHARATAPGGSVCTYFHGSSGWCLSASADTQCCSTQHRQRRGTRYRGFINLVRQVNCRHENLVGRIQDGDQINDWDMAAARLVPQNRSWQCSRRQTHAQN